LRPLVQQVVLEQDSCLKYKTSRIIMASSNFPFLEGNSINRPLVFNGEGYHYWKTRMQIFIVAIDLNIWEAIEIGSFILTMVVGNATIEKPREEWDDDERRKEKILP